MVSCFAWSVALYSSDLLLAYPLIPLAHHITIILISTLKQKYLSFILMQWAALESLNTIKDTCPHGNVFQQESRDLLAAMQHANQEAYDNLMRWNGLEWAKRGNHLDFAGVR